MRPVALAISASVLAALLLASAAGATSWSSFLSADIKGITITPQLQTDQLNYILAMDNTPTIKIGGDTYNINWIQAYYVVGKDKNTSFTATNGTTVVDWKWDRKTSPGMIAGWDGTGYERILPGESKELGFGSFDISDSAVLSGLHLGYDNGCREETGMFKDYLISTGNEVPEPAPLICLATGLLGVTTYTLRRRGRRG